MSLQNHKAGLQSDKADLQNHEAGLHCGFVSLQEDEAGLHRRSVKLRNPEVARFRGWAGKPSGSQRLKSGPKRTNAATRRK